MRSHGALLSVDKNSYLMSNTQKKMKGERVRLGR
jgi:hypothetical protein